MVSLHLDLIAEHLPAVRAALAPFEPDLAIYKDMRDNYEHLDERLVGKERGKRFNGDPRDLGNLSGDIFSFGGKHVDVGPKSLARLREIVEAALAVVPDEVLPPASHRGACLSENVTDFAGFDATELRWYRRA